MDIINFDFFFINVEPGVLNENRSITEQAGSKNKTICKNTCHTHGNGMGRQR